MRMATPAEAARELNMEAVTIKRRAKKGLYPYLMIGTHMLVDIDVLAPMVKAEREQQNGINILDLSKAVGLTVTAIKRGTREGWIPFWMENRRYRFKLEAVQKAIQEKMGLKAEGAGA